MATDGRCLVLGRTVLLVLAATACGLLARPAPTQGFTTWTRARIVTWSLYHDMAYDSRRARIVRFGGLGLGLGINSMSADTWEWDGTDWTRRLPVTSPIARSNHAMAYDAARGRVVLFGGEDRSWSLIPPETWEWDGSDWLLLTPPSSPAARSGHALAYDAARQRVVLFGGEANSLTLDDTWAWDGSTWTLLQPAVRPSARTGHEMAYDAAAGQIVLFGGFGSAADTWTFDGSSWTQRAVAGPTARSGHMMAYDASRRRVVLHGGQSGASSMSDTWEWDGLAWTQVAASLARGYAAMAYDDARREMVLFGGSENASLPADTWTFAGRLWTRRGFAQFPPNRWGHAMVRDPVPQHLVMFGGARPFHGGGAVYLDDTWLWDGGSWRSPPPGPRPAARAQHAMAHDGVRRRVVLFGGTDSLSFSAFGDTWEWDGAAWLQRTPATSPPARAAHAMAFDQARQRIVLFGGGASSSFRADTWEFDGSTWLQRSPPLSPSPRGGHLMEYDIGRQRVVLYGGGGASPLIDTWEWDGVTWTQRATTGPAFGLGGGMAFDEARQRIVLLGGGFTSAETWEWDGSAWTRPTMANPPPVRSQAALAYDPVARRILLFGGHGFDPMYFVHFSYGDTWLYGELRAPSAAPLGSPCSGTSGLPDLSSDGPYLGAPRFTLELRAARGTSPCAFGLSAGTHSQPIGGGCTLYLQAPIAAVLAMTSPAGTASTGFGVPVLASLRGVSLFAQAFVADPQGAAGGLAATAGRRLVIGD